MESSGSVSIVALIILELLEKVKTWVKKVQDESFSFIFELSGSESEIQKNFFIKCCKGSEGTLDGDLAHDLKDYLKVKEILKNRNT